MKKYMHELYVGITTWNSELFLEQCLSSIIKTTEGITIQIGVLDNVSTDRSVEIAKDYGADVKIEHCSQAIALNSLLRNSTGARTLLIHSDVVLLSPNWYQICKKYLAGNSCLVSPEDIGCGPLTRPYGKGMPESCFLLFDTKKIMSARSLTWKNRKGIPLPELHLNLENYYVTHDLPSLLHSKDLTWKAMQVYSSPTSNQVLYEPSFTPEYWSDELANLKYAMGNFYSLDGEITHYHNWFDRLPKNISMGSKETTEGNGKGLPLAFLSAGTNRFLDDYNNNQVTLPNIDDRNESKTPQVVTRNIPNLNIPYKNLVTDTHKSK